MLKLDKEPVGEEKTATEAVSQTRSQSRHEPLLTLTNSSVQDYTAPEAESATEATKQSPKVEVQ